MPNSNKSIRKNYFYNMGYQGLLLIVPLIVTPYVSRVLGADGVGIYSYTLSIVSYFVLFATLGTVVFGQREVSYVQANDRDRTIVFWNTFIFRLITSSVVSAIYYLFCLFQNENQTIYFIFILNIVAVATDISWFFQGLEEFGKIIIRNAIFKIINILYIFYFVKGKEDLVLYVVGMCLIPAVGNILMWFILPRYIIRISIREIHPFHKIKDIISLFIPTVAIQVYTVLDKTMIGLITKSSFQNGYYDRAETLSKMALTIVTSLGLVLIPRIGYYFAQKKYKEIQEYMYRSYRFVWMMGLPLCLGLIGVSSNLVPWFFGPGYDEVIPLLQILSLLIIAIGINNVTGMQYLIPTKRQNMFTLTVSVGAVVNLIGNLILIRLWAGIGAAVASVMAESAIAITQLIIVRNELSPLHVISLCRNYLLSGLLMLIVVEIESFLLAPSIINTFIMVLSGASIYAISLIVFKDQFFIDNLNRILIKLHIKKG